MSYLRLLAAALLCSVLGIVSCGPREYPSQYTNRQDDPPPPPPRVATEDQKRISAFFRDEGGDITPEAITVVESDYFTTQDGGKVKAAHILLPRHHYPHDLVITLTPRVRILAPNQPGDNWRRIVALYRDIGSLKSE